MAVASTNSSQQVDGGGAIGAGAGGCGAGDGAAGGRLVAMVMVVVMMTTHLGARLKVLLKGGKRLLRGGHVAGLERALKRLEIRAGLTVAAGQQVLHPRVVLHILLPRGKRALSAAQVTRLQRTFQCLEVLDALCGIGVEVRLISTCRGRNAADAHAGWAFRV